MTPREIKKKQVELMKVQAAKAEMELKILDREDDINRLVDNIKIQDVRIIELKDELGKQHGQ